MTALGCLQTSTESMLFFLLVWAIVVLGCSCLLRTAGGLWNQYILVLECVRLWGSASLWFFALERICNYQHMAQTQDLLFFWLAHSTLLLHTCTFILLYKSVASLLFGEICCFLHKTMLFWGQPQDENSVCVCAFVCESHYHNLQPIKEPEKCSIDGFDYHVLFGVLGWKKNTRPNKESPYGGTGAKRVGWESGEAFHLVSFVWVKMSNENKQRKGICIIPQ